MSRTRSFAGLIAVAVLVGAPSLAIRRQWSVTSGDWSIPANWGGTLPSSYGNDYIGNGGTATLTTGGSCGGLYVGSGASKSCPARPLSAALVLVGEEKRLSATPRSGPATASSYSPAETTVLTDSPPRSILLTMAQTESMTSRAACWDSPRRLWACTMETRAYSTKQAEAMAPSRSLFLPCTSAGMELKTRLAPGPTPWDQIACCHPTMRSWPRRSGNFQSDRRNQYPRRQYHRRLFQSYLLQPYLAPQKWVG